ncbi:MAG: hypothetical protein JW739_03530 [Opitutales bacterium]|nr:hypothetical protein [Opitutales bacterium]
MDVESCFPEIQTCLFLLDEDERITDCPADSAERILCPIRDIKGLLLRDVLTAVQPSWSQLLPEVLGGVQRLYLPFERKGQKLGAGVILHVVNGAKSKAATITPELAPPNALGEVSIQDLPQGPFAQAQMFLRLRTAENRLQNYMHNFPGIFFSQRPDLSFSYIGPGLQQMLNTSPDGLLRSGNSFLDLLLEADRDTFPGELDEQSRSGKTFSLNYRLRHPQNGNILYVMDVRTPKRSPAGLLLGYEGVILDITRQSIAENRLSQAAWKESLATLTSGLIHDFSNIMAGIYSLSELYYSSLDKEHAWYRGMQQIMTNSREARKLVRRIIDLNREISGQWNYFNLERLIEDQMDLIQIIMPRRTAIEVNLTGEELPLYIDDVSFRQMLLNLAMNARDALEKDGRFSISVAKTAVGDLLGNGQKAGRDGVLIRVSDNGCGIPPEYLEKIFDPFFTTKEVHQGSGFGLYNARLFVEQHKGYISVESTPGKGTDFLIWLPLADFTENQEEEDMEENGAATLRKRIALYAKLDATNFELVSSMQEKEWELITFSDAASAMNFLGDRTFHPHALFVIFTHNDKGAEELVQFAREKHPDVLRIIQPLGCNPDELPGCLHKEADLLLEEHLRTPQIIRKVASLLSR